MKVYAVIKNKEGYKLLVWSSKKEFNNDNSWCDEKYIDICVSSQLSYYEEKEYKGPIIKSDDEKVAHLLLNEVYHEHK